MHQCEGCSVMKPPHRGARTHPHSSIRVSTTDPSRPLNKASCFGFFFTERLVFMTPNIFPCFMFDSASTLLTRLMFSGKISFYYLMLTVTTVMFEAKLLPSCFIRTQDTAGVSMLFAGDCFHLADAAVLRKQRAEGNPLSTTNTSFLSVSVFKNFFYTLHWFCSFSRVLKKSLMIPVINLHHSNHQDFLSLDLRLKLHSSHIV